VARDKIPVILIALGSNRHSAVGPPAATLAAALEALAAAGVTIEAVSRFFASPAWPDPSDPPYVNAVARVRTAMTPAQLMGVLHAVEARFGRERRALNAPRTLDLDLIDFDGRVESPPGGPELPHPRAAGRAFVLAPLLDVAPGWREPISGVPAGELLGRVEAEGNRASPLS
jgi:2-amino-4-hydroxy-6-hydroxymethyldihydropteridine diphosphokinase